MNTQKKICSIENIAKILETRNGKKVVYCHGVFDLLHIGHLRHFKQAKNHGDILVVTLTPDRWVDKGPMRPAFPEQLRAEALASLSCIDYVAINNWPTAENSLKLLKPDYYAKGAEFEEAENDRTGKIKTEIDVVKEIGATFVTTKDIIFSSSNLINKYFSVLPDETQEYIDLFRSRWSISDVLKVLDEMSKLKVLVLGETILDEYVYCDMLGTSSKDPVLAVKEKDREMFAGGTLAIANHLAELTDHVDVVTILGEDESYESFIREHLNQSITPHFFYRENSSTLIKRRFIDSYTLNKLFEIYVMDDSTDKCCVDEKLQAFLLERLLDYDLVLVGDYGHGAINQKTADILSEKSPYLAVNSQANAGNRGFHSFSRYKKADYICIAEHEIRLELRQADGPYNSKLPGIGRRMGCEKFAVTTGKKGCTLWREDEGLTKIPALAAKVVDRVGAGDAFLSVTALAAKLNAPNEVIGFIGNISGALAVNIVGNKESVDKKSIMKAITAVLK